MKALFEDVAWHEYQQVQHDGFTLTATVEHDDLADLSLLGASYRYEPSNAYFVDRKHGALMGPCRIFQGSFNTEAEALEALDALPLLTEYIQVYDAREHRYAYRYVPAPEYAEIETDVEYDDDDNPLYTVWVAYHPLLRDNLSRWESMNEDRYFEPEHNLPHDPDSWSHVDDETIARLLEEHGSLFNVDVHYAAEDYERWAAFVRGDWHMVTVSVVAEYEGEEVGFACLSGVESDGDYIDEVANELADEALSEARDNAEVLAEKLRAKAAKLEAKAAKLKAKAARMG